MLIHYFGTKEELLVQALATQRPDLSAVFADVADAADLRDRLWKFWRSNADGAESTSVRVMLQVLGAACATDGPFRDYATEAIAAFIGALAAALCRIESVDDPEVVATLLVSGLRGVLQDRFVTGEVERTDRAALRLIETVLG